MSRSVILFEFQFVHCTNVLVIFYYKINYNLLKTYHRKILRKLSYRNTSIPNPFQLFPTLHSKKKISIRIIATSAWGRGLAKKNENQLGRLQKDELRSYAHLLGVPHSSNRATIAKAMCRLRGGS